MNVSSYLDSGARAELVSRILVSESVKFVTRNANADTPRSTSSITLSPVPIAGTIYIY